MRAARVGRAGVKGAVLVGCVVGLTKRVLDSLLDLERCSLNLRKYGLMVLLVL
jgi:hypothetical protein